MKSVSEMLQPLGRALMLPIVVLPVAGLMLRLGQHDMLNMPFVAAAGGAVFSGLGLLFAIGVAVGLARENHGAAGLAGAVCFLVATAGAKAILPVPPEALAGYGAAAHDLAADAFKTDALAKLAVPIGIVSGIIAGSLYNRFYNIKLPDYLAFFGGRRFVPIVAGFAALLLAAIVGVGAPAISRGMDVASHLVLSAGPFGLFIYGVLNRLLIVTGLHHIVNNFAWFILGDYHGTTGDMKRFFAGDPSAGAFMAGFFPVMMFGLPAACLAMYHAVAPQRRKAVGGLLASMALTAFLTGVTEPIEFSFMFLAPPLYAIHAVLTGASMMLMDALHIRLGFSFSAGLVDYVINFNKASRPLWLLPVGAAYFAIYYLAFRYTIKAFNLKDSGTRGRRASFQEIGDRCRGAGTRLCRCAGRRRKSATRRCLHHKVAFGNSIILRHRRTSVEGSGRARFRAAVAPRAAGGSWADRRSGRRRYSRRLGTIGASAAFQRTNRARSFCNKARRSGVHARCHCRHHPRAGRPRKYS